jgi:hypothetical protein
MIIMVMMVIRSSHCLHVFPSFVATTSAASVTMIVTSSNFASRMEMDVSLMQNLDLD